MLCSNVMATVKTLWLLPIIMTGWCFSFKGAAVRPSPPECYRPCNDGSCSDITCTWDPIPGPENNATYTLHWEGHQSKDRGHRAVIKRDQFTDHSELTVWVQTKAQDGTVSRSENVTFNTADIYKPSPPKIRHHKPIEIHWTSSCEHHPFEVGHCEVRHRTEAQPAWIQKEEGGVSGSYSLSRPELCTDYFFQVRCQCVTSLMSDWSAVHTVRGAERAPLGLVDVWRDCGMLPQSSECVLMWKKLPMSKACGHILGYTLRLFFKNGTDALVALNGSDEASLRLVCSEIHCYYNSSLKGVKSVSINAYNAHGNSANAHLDIQVPVKIPKERQEAITLEMNENNLTVSWNIESWISNVNGFVVQYKEAGSSLGQGLDWIRLNTNLTNVTIYGQFKKFTAYQVSVFTELDHNKVRLYCTDVAHYVQGIPTKVLLSQGLPLKALEITLLWGPVMMSVQKDVTPYYQIGYGKDNVYNVSAYPQLENRTFTLDNLEENHYYVVWIKAVNQAGPGPNTTMRFQTLSSEKTGAIKKFFLGFGVVLFLFTLFWLLCYRNYMASLFEKVPDPHNSNIIKEIMIQINGPMALLHAPLCPEISEIEIVKTSSFAFIPQADKCTNTENEDPPENIVTEEHKKARYGCSKQEYSKMLDSDDEKNEEEETGGGSSSSEEDDAGYEQHFMPTESDIQEIQEIEEQERSEHPNVTVFC